MVMLYRDDGDPVSKSFTATEFRGHYNILQWIEAPPGLDTRKQDSEIQKKERIIA